MKENNLKPNNYNNDKTMKKHPSKFLYSLRFFLKDLSLHFHCSQLLLKQNNNNRKVKSYDYEIFPAFLPTTLAIGTLSSSVGFQR